MKEIRVMTLLPLRQWFTTEVQDSGSRIAWEGLRAGLLSRVLSSKESEDGKWACEA